jgi:outer membrane autotransporter protein
MGQGSTNFEDPSVRVESDYWHAGGYATVSFGAVTVDSSALFGSSDDSSTRGVVGGRADASFGSKDTQLGLGVSINLISKSGAWQLTPVLRLKYVSYEQDGFNETGPNGRLLFRASGLSEDTVISKLGVRVAHRSQLSKHFALGVDGAAYWVHDFNSEGRDLSMGLNGAVGSFMATGRDGFADTAQLNLGLQATLSEVVSIRLSGQQDIGVNRTQSTGAVAMGWSF